MSHVIFRKQVSDGNYGTESAEVLLEIDDATDDELVATGLALARQLVHAELAKSPAWRVRDAVTPSELPAESTGTLPDSDDPEDLPY
ncbi:MAG TPA: hypothetical protein VFB50_02510 [Chloroflexota bacterium]|nr:hypothetical protein [Chloroflexota bacterium]